IARPLAASIERRRFSDESRRRARETKALREAGRAVTASLDVGRTIRVILEEARAVLGVDSCSVSTIDPLTNDLILVASLDIAPEMTSTVRLHHGEGIAGLAVQAGRPMQSRDTWADARVRFPELQRGGAGPGLRAGHSRLAEAAVAGRLGGRGARVRARGVRDAPDQLARGGDRRRR